jgi:hypothetical protein
MDTWTEIGAATRSDFFGESHPLPMVDNQCPNALKPLDK